jgi:hypothetical protein
MTPLGILTLIVGALALLSLAAYACWLWREMPHDDPADDALFQARERRQVGR